MALIPTRTGDQKLRGTLFIECGNDLLKTFDSFEPSHEEDIGQLSFCWGLKAFIRVDIGQKGWANNHRSLKAEFGVFLGAEFT